MPDNEHTLISVRGEAERVVTPDSVRISISVSAVAPTKSEASAIVVRVLARLTSALGELGGEALTVSTMRAPLSWSTHSIQTHEDWDHSKDTRHATRHRSTAEVAITVRAFDRLDQLTQIFADQDEIDVYSVSWSVDEDNSEWAQVRADAIRAALIKGRDYAAALGGVVVRVEHVADSGLLGSESSRPATAQRAMAYSSHEIESSGGADDGVSLDPVPQKIRAIIEARVTATVGPLPR